MARAIGARRPRRLAGVRNFEQDGVLLVAQPERAGAGQRIRAGVRSENARDAVGCLDRRRVTRDDDIRASRQHHVRRERVINVARKTVPANLLQERVGVIDLHELQHVAVRVGSRVIHDFRNGKRRQSAGGPGRFHLRRIRHHFAAGDGLEIAKLRARGHSIGAAGHRHSEEDRVGHVDVERAEPHPAVAIQARVAGEEIVRPLQA